MASLQKTHRQQECLLGSEQQYGEWRELQQTMMVAKEHEWESPSVLLKQQCQVIPCVPSSNPYLVLCQALDHLE
jgi:hypothetical protein